MILACGARRLLAPLAAVCLVTAACGSTEPTDQADVRDAADIDVPSEALDAAAAFVAAWQNDDFDTAVDLFDADALRVIGREINNSSLIQLARPGFHLDAAAALSGFDEPWPASAAVVFAAIDKAGASAVDLDHPVAGVSPVDATTIEVTFTTRDPVRFTMTEADSQWQIRRVDEIGTTDHGEVFGMADPTAGTDWVWCGHNEPVVLNGVDCGRVEAGLAGITDAERAEIDELRQRSLDDPSQALALTQAMQSILATAPGQVCRLMQRGEVAAGEAQDRAAELRTTICPIFEPLDLALAG